MRVSHAVPLLLTLLVSLFISGCILDDDDYKVVYPSNQTDRLTLLNVTWKWDDKSYPNLVVSGRVENTGSIEVKNVRICMKAYDSHGTLIASDDTPFSSIDGRTTVAWEITDSVDEEPTKVTIGYSYDAEVVVSAKKTLP